MGDFDLRECNVCSSARIVTHVITLDQDSPVTFGTLSVARGTFFVNLIEPGMFTSLDGSLNRYRHVLAPALSAFRNSW